MFVQILESERKTLGITQSNLAKKFGLSERAYRGYVAGERELHPVTQNLISRLLKSPRLATMVLAQFEDNPFAPATLEVDDHPAQTMIVAINELREALASVDKINPCRPDIRAVEHAIDQMMDLIHLIPIMAGSWAKQYDLDLWRLRERNLRKLRNRGYLKSTEGVSAA